MLAPGGTIAVGEAKRQAPRKIGAAARPTGIAR
jgi:hypothetical protein